MSPQPPPPPPLTSHIADLNDTYSPLVWIFVSPQHSSIYSIYNFTNCVKDSVTFSQKNGDVVI